MGLAFVQFEILRKIQQKIEPETNIPNKHRCTNLPQNISRLNPTTHQKKHPHRQRGTGMDQHTNQ